MKARHHGILVTAAFGSVFAASALAEGPGPSGGAQRDEPRPLQQQARPSPQHGQQAQPMPNNQPMAPMDEQARPSEQPRSSDRAAQPGAPQSAAERAAQPSNGSRLTDLESNGIALTSLQSEAVKNLQRKLQQEGYYTAEIDGRVGGQTRQALRQFYSDQARLAAKGMILPESAEALGLDVSRSMPAGGNGEEP